MKTNSKIHLSDVQGVYSGAERRLWELLMGEQIHIGGLQSSTDLATTAGIGAGQHGVDFCCASGAGMRFLLRFRGVARMTGVDATRAMLDLARTRCEDEGFDSKAQFVEAGVDRTGLPGGQFDFVWGEDAWCYVENKPGLVAEAARLLKPSGVVAFTDWMEGPAGLTNAEAERFLTFMKFPSLPNISEYQQLLQSSGCAIVAARDTGRFAEHIGLYIDMIEKQLTYDALKIIGFDTAMAQALLTEMRFMQDLAKAGKTMQGLIVAKKQP